MKTDAPSGQFRRQVPLGYLVHELARLMKRRLDDEARMHKITLPQWRTLAQVGQKASITQSALANALDIDPMTISGVLDRLEKNGLISREPDPADSRAKLTQLTPEGAERLEVARRLGAEMYEAALSGISKDDIATAEKVLRQMQNNLLGLTATPKDQ
ncbi:MarR family winged helix-turn-helix transcriptional regulator [Devosia rhizoryzae]|uniref:MarR family transcriptional regulator n=1 Tax=Devosia rhizoryzae TaxID=2774137 RepID=A0ABX7C712_9HYPH|nr:MarR family transcriptional regulator [Devosia rhizoryzae]QQR38517.1 MarR family transcriptional regulator [Devosia rhizoryzae]